MNWIEIPEDKSKRRDRLRMLLDDLDWINQERMRLIEEIDALERSLAKVYSCQPEETTTGVPVRYPSSRVQEKSFPGEVDSRPPQ